MTAKIAGNDARTCQVDQFAVVIARPRLGTLSIVTSRVASYADILWARHAIFLTSPKNVCVGGYLTGGGHEKFLILQSLSLDWKLVITWGVSGSLIG